MPLLQTSSSASARASGFARNALTKIYDLFNRVTAGSLGTTTSGSLWHAITGVWSSNSGTAQTATSPASNPMATVIFQPNATLTLQNVTPGAGLCFWESDAGDWWGAVATSAEVLVQTGTGFSFSACCTGSNTCISNSCCPADAAPCSFFSPAPFTCAGTYNGGVLSSVVNAGGVVTCHYTGCCVANSCCTGTNTCVSGNCIAFPIYTNYYNYLIQILQSVASTVSVIASSVLAQLTVSGGVNGIKSLSVNTEGENVSATGYSDSNMADALGSVNAMAGSTPTATGVGIMLVAVDSTASAIQGSTVGPFTAI